MNTSNNIARTLLLLTIGLLTLIAISCGRQARSKSQVSNQSAAPDPTIEVSSADNDSSADDPCSQMFSSFFVEADSLAYNDYEIARLHKVVHDKESGFDVPDTYAVLKSKGNVVATFDGFYYPAGNFTDFGFAPLLSGEARQLVVSQTVPRGGRHWIVDLSSDGAVVFDSKDWGLGSEDVCIHDYDGDAIEEISLEITKFWGFGAMSMAESPLPTVIFKYDPSIRKYLPDKPAFLRGLDHIDEDVQTVDPDEKPREESKGPYLATRLDIFLRYIYAGRENDAWSFFEKAYNLKDKHEIEQKIRAALANEPIYRFVYGKSSGRN